MRAVQSITILFCAAMLSFAASIASAEENEIFNDLMQNGVTLSDGTKAELPPIAMPDGLNAAGQLKVIEGLVAKTRLASFRGGNPNDWHQLNIGGRSATAAQPSSERHIDLYYMANGTLETIADKGFIRQVMGASGAVQVLSDKQLKPLGIDLPADTATKRERYAHAKLDLFNMANVRATAHLMSVQNKDSLLVAFKVDPQFDANANFPNQWGAIKLGPAGVKALGIPQPYDGVGGYAKLTRVAESAKPQVFVEYHLVFDEPFAWFEGKPVLTSKLPMKVEADVRSFRKDIIKFMRAAAPPPVAAQANANPNAAGGVAASEEKEKKTETVQTAAQTTDK